VRELVEHIPYGFRCWLAGFADGEGCFSIQGPSNKGSYRCSFTIKLRADDLPLLNTIRDITGIGKVRLAYPPKRNAQVRWDVDRKADVLVLRELFEWTKLLSKKRRDFELWAEAVDIWACVQGSTSQDWGPTIELQRRLTEVRAFEMPKLEERLAIDNGAVRADTLAAPFSTPRQGGRT
jgi:hypothetical protein